MKANKVKFVKETAINGSVKFYTVIDGGIGEYVDKTVSDNQKEARKKFEETKKIVKPRTGEPTIEVLEEFVVVEPVAVNAPKAAIKTGKSK